MKRSIKIALSIFGIALLGLAQSGMVDDLGSRHTAEGLNRALVTYGISRGLNGVISVVQGTEVAVEPIGVGMTFTPGQILDPVNDLIERFSTVVLFSGTAFGVQRVLLDIVSTPAFSLLVIVLVVLAIGLLWFASNVSASFKTPCYRLALIFLIIRFSVPTLAIASETFYQTFLAPQYQESSQQLLSTTDRLRDIQAQTEVAPDAMNEERSLLDSARDLYRSARNSLDIQKHIDDFKVAAETISEHAIKLIVVFVFQTVLLPLVSVWLIYKCIHWVAIGRIWIRATTPG